MSYLLQEKMCGNIHVLVDLQVDMQLVDSNL